MKNCTLSRVEIHIGISYLYSKPKPNPHRQCMMCYHIRNGHNANLVLTLKYGDCPTNHGSCQSDYSRRPYMGSEYYIIHHILVHMFWSELFKSHKFEFYLRLRQIRISHTIILVSSVGFVQPYYPCHTEKEKREEKLYLVYRKKD